MPQFTLPAPQVTVDVSTGNFVLAVGCDRQLPGGSLPLAQRLRFTATPNDASGNGVTLPNSVILSYNAPAIVAAMPSGTLPGGVTPTQFLACLDAIHAAIIKLAGGV